MFYVLLVCVYDNPPVIYVYVLLAYWEKGFTHYVHCLSSRVRIGDTREVVRP